ncbi:MAG TPA: hypothetical protein VFN66_06700 [Burkholderiales bacterium]|nr:hypothetical protein [Burkholderiales bacterium]
MKLFALLLLLANFLVFFWIEWGQTGAQPLPAEIHPETISLIPQAGGGQSAAVPKPIAASSSIAPPAKPANPETSLPAAAKSAVPSAAQKIPAQSNATCLNWGPIPAKRADDAQARLLKFKLGNRLSYTDDATARSGPYWVYFPPLPTKLAADEKLAALEALGLKDIAVVRTGTWKNAISMGLYSKEPIAEARVAAVANKGVTAKIDARGAASRTYTLSNLTPDERSALLTMQENFGGPAFKKTTCPVP